jgi:hypothetical protein
MVLTISAADNGIIQAKYQVWFFTASSLMATLSVNYLF